jgi:type IV pilus assembly protein PilM
MGLSFLNKGNRGNCDQILAVDLGGRVTKAVQLQRRGTGLALTGFVLLDAPIYEKAVTVELLTEHFKLLSKSLAGKNKQVVFTLGVGESLLRPVEIPPMPVEDMRMILKNNSRAYLQQELQGYVFDCHVLAGQALPAGTDAKAAGGAKQKVLVAGAKAQLVDDLVQSARSAGYVAESILPGVIGPVNAFERAMPEVFNKESVALVDIGFKNSSICLLRNGELVLSRTVAMGGDKMTTTVSESMNITYAEAEGIKLGMAQEVQEALNMVLSPLGRELRASMDFFEHQQDHVVGQVFLSGGPTRSPIVVEGLQNELLAECKLWNPVSGLTLELPPDKAAELEALSPQLPVAVGAGLAVL